MDLELRSRVSVGLLTSVDLSIIGLGSRGRSIDGLSFWFSGSVDDFVAEAETEEICDDSTVVEETV